VVVVARVVVVVGTPEAGVEVIWMWQVAGVGRVGAALQTHMAHTTYELNDSVVTQ
jgi:hypothetical protein